MCSLLAFINRRMSTSAEFLWDHAVQRGCYKHGKMVILLCKSGKERWLDVARNVAEVRLGLSESGQTGLIVKSRLLSKPLNDGHRPPPV